MLERLFNSKRGTDLALPDLFSALMWGLVVLIFVVLFGISFKGCGDDKPMEDRLVSAANYHVEANLLLLNYLRSPIGGALNNADLILAWSNLDSSAAAAKDGWKSKIIGQTTPLFERKYGTGCYYLCVDDGKDKICAGREQMTELEKYSGLYNSPGLSAKPPGMLPAQLQELAGKESVIYLPKEDGSQIKISLSIQEYAQYRLQGFGELEAAGKCFVRDKPLPPPIQSIELEKIT